MVAFSHWTMTDYNTRSFAGRPRLFRILVSEPTSNTFGRDGLKLGSSRTTLVQPDFEVGIISNALAMI